MDDVKVPSMTAPDGRGSITPSRHRTATIGSGHAVRCSTRLESG
jgi:hypothetical protein